MKSYTIISLRSTSTLFVFCLSFKCFLILTVSLLKYIVNGNKNDKINWYLSTVILLFMLQFQSIEFIKRSVYKRYRYKCIFLVTGLGYSVHLRNESQNRWILGLLSWKYKRLWNCIHKGRRCFIEYLKINLCKIFPA